MWVPGLPRRLQLLQQGDWCACVAGGFDPPQCVWLCSLTGSSAAGEAGSRQQYYCHPAVGVFEGPGLCTGVLLGVGWCEQFGGCGLTVGDLTGARTGPLEQGCGAWVGP
jgi:hypothetical protein